MFAFSKILGLLPNFGTLNVRDSVLISIIIAHNSSQTRCHDEDFFDFDVGEIFRL